MRTIHKGSEPPCLVEERAAKRRYSDIETACKDEIRVALAREQGSLCCYCLRRIRPDPASMVIEHFVTQTDPVEGRALELDWKNLFGSCQGNSGKRLADQHCDARKGNQRIRASLLDPNLRKKVRYLADGRVTSNSKEIKRELNETLNLNLAFLMSARKAVLAAFVEFATKKRSGGWTATYIENLIAGLSNGPQLQEHVEIIIQFLEQRLERA